MGFLEDCFDLNGDGKLDALESTLAYEVIANGLNAIEPDVAQDDEDFDLDIGANFDWDGDF